MNITFNLSDEIMCTQVLRLLELYRGPEKMLKVPPSAETAPLPVVEVVPAVKVLDLVPSKEISGDEMRKAAGVKAKALGAEGSAKVKAFVGALDPQVKSIADVAPEDRATVLAKLEALV